MNVNMLMQYFHRIELDSSPELDAAYLTKLHEHQHKTIPFENFDVINKRPILLSETDLFQKLVIHSRGGYCFELNGLLLAVLKAVGFEVRPLLGRVHLSGAPSGRGHQISLVTINQQQWIVDAGFGAQTPRQPLPLTLNQELNTDTQTFRFIEDDNFGVLLQVKHDLEWVNLYSLDMSHVCDGDVEYGNHYTSTNCNSAFTSRCVASIRTDSGVITLLNNRLKIKSDTGSEEIILDSEDNYFSALKQYFGINLDIPFSSISKYF